MPSAKSCQRRFIRALRLSGHAALVWAAACGGTPAPPPPGTLIIGIESAPATLDPRFTTDANSSLLGSLVTNGLTRNDEHAEAVADLAADWRQLSPLEYLFTLRPDARFHDGTPVRAADVAATYRSVIDPHTGSPKREALAEIASITTPDERTVVFRLRKLSAAFLEVTNLGILPARLAAGPQPGHSPAVTGPIDARKLIGAGPFRVAATDGEGGVDLEPHPGYMNGPARIARLRFRIVPDGVVRGLELASGAIHMVQNALEPDLLPWLAAQPNLELLISPGTTFQYLGGNFRDPRFADRRVRRALAYGLDRQGIAHHVLRNTARLATGLLPPTHWAFEGKVASYSYDPARAERLLVESGLGRQARHELRRFSYKTSTVELRRRIAEVFQQNLAAVGIGLDIRTYEWATFYADVRRGNFELYALAWVGVSDPDVYYRIFHSRMRPPAGDNRGGYSNRRMDALLEAARQTGDRTLRRRLYARVQRLAAKDLPVVPLWWADNVVVKSTALKGFAPLPDGNLASLATATFEPATAINRAKGQARCPDENAACVAASDTPRSIDLNALTAEKPSPK